MTKRSAGSQYMRLAEHLLQQIQEGTYRQGDLLPSEAQLCEQFNISRITARAALKELEIGGAVSRRAGIGTRVLSQTVSRPVFAHAGGSIDEVLYFTRGVSFKLLDQSMFTVTPEQALELKIPEGQRFSRLHALRKTANGSKLLTSVHYVPALLTPSVGQLASLNSSLAQFIAENHGDEIQSIRQEIGACLLDATQAEMLKQPAGSAAVSSRRWYMGREGKLILLSLSVFPAEHYRFESVLIRNVGQ